MNSFFIFFFLGVAGSGPRFGPTRTANNRFRRSRRRILAQHPAGQLRGSGGRQRGRIVSERRVAAAVRAAATGAGHPQARVRARAATRAHLLRAQEAGAAASTTAEALQDRVHQGAHAAHAHRARHTGHRAAGRTEDAHLRAGQETGRGARDPHTHARAHATVQTGSVLHQIQDAGENVRPCPQEWLR